jgi:hypothetical protein
MITGAKRGKNQEQWFLMSVREDVTKTILAKDCRFYLVQKQKQPEFFWRLVVCIAPITLYS